MLLFLLFAGVANAADACETSTCRVCKNTTGCDWYGFDCYNKTGSAVTTLNIPATATCSPCQAGSCFDCQDQDGCAWFNNKIPGAPGKCDGENTTSSFYTKLDVCPTCQLQTTCTACEMYNETCGWYQLAGVAGGKCREAAPSFAYSKVKLGYCAGDPCNGQNSCKKCQDVKVNNATVCSWYNSKSPTFFNSKCDDSTGGVLSDTFYDKAVGCPTCAGTTCTDCKSESGCKWVAVSTVFGTSFGQCMNTTSPTPSTKTEITTCPAACKVHSCTACQAVPQCSWFTGGGDFVDDSCDLTTDGKFQHPTQTIATTCPACAADRCYECNGISGCGWYAKLLFGKPTFEGCYSTANPPDRTLLPNTDSRCEGVPGSSAHVTISLVVLVALALVA